MKKCTKCKIEKTFYKFSKVVRWLDWLSSQCKKCLCEKQNKYKRTIPWLVTAIYSKQRISSKRRWHNMPNYTRIELEKWIIKQNNFKKLYDNWVNSWYSKMIVPSVDRIDDYKWYSFDNIQLMTWKENKDKSHKDMRNGKLTNWVNPQKKISWVNLKTGEIIKFHSMMEAERNIWVDHWNISNCCNWKNWYTQAWWYRWSFN